MKQKILILSAISSVIATGLAIIGVLSTGPHDPESLVTCTKYFGLGGLMGLLGIALFFVGLVFPREA